MRRKKHRRATTADGEPQSAIGAKLTAPHRASSTALPAGVNPAVLSV
jgi:hypothetical protein